MKTVCKDLVSRHKVIVYDLQTSTSGRGSVLRDFGSFPSPATDKRKSVSFFFVLHFVGMCVIEDAQIISTSLVSNYVLTHIVGPRIFASFILQSIGQKGMAAARNVSIILFCCSFRRILCRSIAGF